ncbi:16S rRNA (uracil(1498)-N(3))-methyltransferase [Capnocytophaga canimorsus]|uniref:16S rRNA (uracil(1498)-N(3))-methyltransferase n=1 Tax=Capnocytophaga canimorsus TaxID=28188 RepID=UPI00384E312F
MQLFYHAQISASTASFSFEKEESQHIVKVLRKKEGDLLHITNGKGMRFEGQISLASAKRCEVLITNFTEIKKHPYHLHLVVAPTKMNERYEWFLEKAVEIGVDEITPIICQNSERKTIKNERFEKIILSAMKQSLQYHLPILHPTISSSDFFEQMKNEKGSKFIAHCQENEKKALASEIQSIPERLTILIGPEGDFSAFEIQKALSENFTPISLGNNRLRTETAAIVACHTVSVMSSLT